LRRQRDPGFGVEDVGVGFDPLEVTSGDYGLRSMHQRIERLSGTLKVRSALGKGTILEGAFPWNDLAKVPSEETAQ
jgi:signal transduction histidine kinase